jgi:structural maintenance of chromosome 4
MPRVRRSRSEKEKEKDEEGEEMEVEVEFEVEQEDEEMTPPAKKNKSAKRGKKRKQEEAEPVPVMRGQEERGEGEGEECAAAAAAALPPVLPDLTLTRDDDGGLQIGAHYIPPPPPPALTFANDRPRLVITHIDNENFKSYAGQQTLGPFHKSFTSIVGPNGSGKSNVIDSMLFVFGYRAAKIRSKKISVLIHSSEQHTTINSCTVRVHFHEIIDKNT